MRFLIRPHVPIVVLSLSLLLHAGAAAAMLAVRVVDHPMGAGTFVSLEVLEPERQEPDTEPVVPPPAPEANAEQLPAAARDDRPRPHRDPEAPTTPGDSEGPEPPMANAPTVELGPSRERPARSQQEIWGLINPGQAAQGQLRALMPTGPARRGAAAPRGRQRTGSFNARARSAELSGYLRTEANRRRHTEGHWEPNLQRRSDGTHHCTNCSVFAAVIHPDGSVSFEDRPDINTDGISTRGSYGLEEAIQRAQGQDPHRARREAFMRHTEELRGRLEAAHRRRTMEGGLRRLRGRLARVWGTSSRSHAARRERIFQIWDDIDEGQSGRQARAIVIAFIRENLPQGSEHAYTEREVARFNARRESRRQFAPY